MARPVGSKTRPQIRDYLNKADIESLVEKARKLAESGDQTMLKFLLEQVFGRAPQPLTGADGKAIKISFDKSFEKDETK